MIKLNWNCWNKQCKGKNQAGENCLLYKAAGEVGVADDYNERANTWWSATWAESQAYRETVAHDWCYLKYFSYCQ